MLMLSHPWVVHGVLPVRSSILVWCQKAFIRSPHAQAIATHSA